MFCTTAAIVSIVVSLPAAVGPDLPIFENVTLDEAIRRNWHSNMMVIVVANSQFTQKDWEHSAWAQPKLVDYLRDRRIRVVYADNDADRAAVWLLDIRSMPAVFVSSTGREQLSRRYFGRNGEPGADEMIDFLEALRSGTSLAERIRTRLGKDPDNAALRWELIRELQSTGDEEGAYTEIAWLLQNPDKHAYDGPDHVLTETQARATLLWIIGSLREKQALWYPDHTNDPQEKPEAVWENLRRRTEWPVYDRHGSMRVHLARLTVETRAVLEGRIEAGTASERDQFIFDALTGSLAKFRTLLELYSEQAELAAMQPSPNPAQADLETPAE